MDYSLKTSNPVFSTITNANEMNKTGVSHTLQYFRNLITTNVQLELTEFIKSDFVSN